MIEFYFKFVKKESYSCKNRRGICAVFEMYVALPLPGKAVDFDALFRLLTYNLFNVFKNPNQLYLSHIKLFQFQTKIELGYFDRVRST